MSDQAAFRMPATGDAWRHYKGELYTIIGMSTDDEGYAQVIYTDYDWSLVQLAPIYNQRLGRFLQEIKNDEPRFAFIRERDNATNCQYIREIEK